MEERYSSPVVADTKDEKTVSVHSTQDVEGGVQKNFEEVSQLKQGLHQRHIQMIALAGTIGTGLFLGSGRALARGGPAGVFMAYTLMGIFVCPVVLAIGEMGALVPLSGGIVRYAESFVDPALAFANGWNEVYSYCVSIPAEIVAAAVLVEFWNHSISSAVWITVFGVVMVTTGVLFVRVYGEIEFLLANLKIMLVVGINIMALVITCGGGPDHQSIGFRYWKDPGPFVDYLGIPGSLGHFLGFWTSFDNALYAFSGIENITVAAAEVRNPRTAIPQAAKRIFARVGLFYVVTIFMVTLVVPSNNKEIVTSSGTASASPFVVAARIAGIKVVPSIINAVVLTSAWSSGNSSLLFGSRILYGLAVNGKAPKIFRRISRTGIPYVAVSLFGCFMCLAYMSIQSTAATVFAWLQDLVSIATLVNWMIILITYLRLFYGCKTQGIDRHTELPWASPFQPYISWASLTVFLLILLTGGYSTFIHGHWSDEVFISSYLNIPLILIAYFGWKFSKKTRIVPLDQIPIRGFLEIAKANPEPVPPKKTGLRRLNVLWT